MVVVVLANTLYRLRIEGRENLPEKGGALIVVNHTSLVDWVFLVASSDRSIRFLVDSSYYHHWLATLERMVAEKGASTGDALEEHYRAWERAMRRTPHGKPIELRPADFRNDR